ncbi:hypothetical protein ACFLQJ_01920, partial [Calditrichota bacterium]
MDPGQDFKTTDLHSAVKMEIVASYFITWASIINRVLSTSRNRKRTPIAYIDLFSGPGRSGDGKEL